MATDYDHVKALKVGPWGINEAATDLRRLSQEVVDSVDRIMTTLNSLTLNDWRGRTQQEADDVENRWHSVMTGLFGSEEKPGDGALNAITSGLATAVQNYDKAESAVAEAWSRFAGAIDGDGGGKPSERPPADVLDTDKTAITADYPPFRT